MTASPMATPLPWDLVSAAYTEEVVPLFEHFSRDALRLAAAPAGSRVVDVACGPGTLSFLAAAAGHPVDALDFSPEMLSYLEARRLRERDTRITAQHGDGQALPYADATFGAGFSMFGLMFFPDRAAGFRELRRVLVPGARAVVSSWPRLEENPILAAMFASIRTALAAILPPNAAQSSAADMPLSTEALCKAEMSAAFADVEVHRVVHVQHADSAEALWEHVKRTMGPVVLMRRNLGDKFAPVDAAANSAIRNAAGPGKVELQLPAWFSVGVAV
jgi:ubiquinone/menaquinone biosynthesis C-methylase UbiE